MSVAADARDHRPACWRTPPGCAARRYTCWRIPGLLALLPGVGGRQREAGQGDLRLPLRDKVLWDSERVGQERVDLFRDWTMAMPYCMLPVLGHPVMTTARRL